MRACARGRLSPRRLKMPTRTALGPNGALPRAPRAPYVQRETALDMDHDNYADGYIRGILNNVKTIAMFAGSANTSRPSYAAFKYLLDRGDGMITANTVIVRRAHLVGE